MMKVGKLHKKIINPLYDDKKVDISASTIPVINDIEKKAVNPSRDFL